MTTDPPSIWDTVRDLQRDMVAMRDTQSENAVRLARMEENIKSNTESLSRIEKRQNWAVGILASAFLLAIANWIVQGGLATVTKASEWLQ